MEGGWRFRLWAPSAPSVTLVLSGGRHPMARSDDGWFETEQPAAAGDEYAYDVGKGVLVPDPAARAQAGDVHGPSQLVDPNAFAWQSAWSGRPWHETVLYELHVGAFSDGGDFDGVRRHLDHLAAIGITAIELCPVAQFSGTRGWGYDGVLLYAPHRAYGGPSGLKHLVDSAHARGLMVFLDVVYNHFGPDGNYLSLYAPDFFHADRHTPWGAAIAYERQPVRKFVVENALYWLEEYRIDGLRLDAIDTIHDPSPVSVIEELARAVRQYPFAYPRHLATEDDRNVAFLHRRDAAGRPILYDGEWNDDFHHVAHVLATGETDGYYGDYAADPRSDLATALRSGYVQQGRPSPYRGGKPRGEPSGDLPPTAFVNFLQNHDQIGNRALGERLTALAEPRAVEVLTALLILSPDIPLLFMGEEWGETNPFLFFCDFHGDLAEAVRKGRRQEFARWKQFADPAARERIPDPNDPQTFLRCKLDWAKADGQPGRDRLALFRKMLDVRATTLAPLLADLTHVPAETVAHGERGLEVGWQLDDTHRLRALLNLGGEPFAGPVPAGEIFRWGNVNTDRWAIHVALER